MKDGMIVQIETGSALPHAAQFLCADLIDASTVVRSRNTRQGNAIKVSHLQIQLWGRLASVSQRRSGSRSDAAGKPDQGRCCEWRPHDAGQRVRGTLDRVVFTGSIFNLHMRMGAEPKIRAAIAIEKAARLGEQNLQPGSIVELHWPP